MAVTYTQIATTTLSVAGSVDFNNIPGTYTDLVIVANGRSTASANTTNAICYFNGDVSTSSYSRTILTGNGSSASSYRESNYSQLYCWDDMPAANATADYFGFWNAHIMNYSNSTTYKTLLIRVSNRSNTVQIVTGLWRNTNAITRFQMGPVSGSFAIGTTFSLYGIKAA